MNKNLVTLALAIALLPGCTSQHNSPNCSTYRARPAHITKQFKVVDLQPIGSGYYIVTAVTKHSHIKVIFDCLPDTTGGFIDL